MQGTIVYIHVGRGFGFIAPSSGAKDLFFHMSDLADDLPFDDQLQERRVEFDVIHTDKGPRATAVRAS